ncbi:hypothetical protein LTZ17_11900 [Lacticaseibacillus casei]|uniref:hypothetical protein n=1 Tax=Lacticaseibacillus TaxID=2759736 RepID=UPI00024925ED|nr:MULTISPECIES: hypothetical protein [Lacticaseibacillus]MDE3283361.1 hypothetical protein [Lacticaseibacillus casei]QVI31520.1 hypothetical protein KG087_11455 [Lacticaseibacillus zeae]
MIITADMVLRVITWISAIALVLYIVAAAFKWLPSSDIIVPMLLLSTLISYFASSIDEE